MHYKLRERAAIWVGIASTLISFLSIMYVGLYPTSLAATLGPSTAGGLSLGFCYSASVFCQAFLVLGRPVEALLYL